jgi:hypothetical protein
MDLRRPSTHWDAGETLADRFRAHADLDSLLAGSLPEQLALQGGCKPVSVSLRGPAALTNQQVMYILRFSDGKAVEHWAARDDMALMRQLGALPGRPAPVPMAG